MSDTEISDIGWCPQCLNNVLDHPALRCPWCNATSGTLAGRELKLADDATVGETIRALTDFMNEMEARILSASAIRHEAARLALAAGDLVAVAKEAGVRVSSLERWAEPPPEAQCSKGHKRSEHGEWTGKKWRCRECARLKPPPAPKTKKPRTPVGKVRDLWTAHDRRMARRDELARQGKIPGRLKPPVAPPVPRASSGQHHSEHPPSQ